MEGKLTGTKILSLLVELLADQNEVNVKYQIERKEVTNEKRNS